MLVVEDHGLTKPHSGKIFHSGIAKKVNGRKRGFNCPFTCDFCARNNEDISHVFRFCDIAKKVLEVWISCDSNRNQ